MPDVRVPQRDGTIAIARNGDEPVVRSVTDHVVTVAEKDLDHFLLHVEGSSVVAKPAPDKKG